MHVVDHPLAQDALLSLRDARTPPAEFRRLAQQMAVLLAAEALRDLPRTPASVETPLTVADGSRVAAEVVVVPILRAGLGLVEAVLSLCPAARVGHIGLQRDEATAVASQYYARLPVPLDGCCVLLVDPMLATGGSAAAALDLLRRSGATDVRLLCVVAAPEGLARLAQHFPDVPVFTAAVDRGLNERAFIVPGLGDFGDRLYGTE